MFLKFMATNLAREFRASGAVLVSNRACTRRAETRGAAGGTSQEAMRDIHRFLSQSVS